MTAPVNEVFQTIPSSGCGCGGDFGPTTRNLEEVYFSALDGVLVKDFVFASDVSVAGKQMQSYCGCGNMLGSDKALQLAFELGLRRHAGDTRPTDVVAGEITLVWKQAEEAAAAAREKISYEARCEVARLRATVFDGAVMVSLYGKGVPVKIHRSVSLWSLLGLWWNRKRS